MRLTAIAASVAFLFAAGNATPAETKDFEDALKEMIAAIKKIGDTLAGVKDKESAEKARPELKKSGEKIKELQAKIEKLGKPTPEQEKELGEKFKKDLQDATNKLVQEAVRLGQTDYGKDVLKELENLNPPKQQP